jgi:cobalt-zinc-cadmium resistance protein CzcA
LPGFSVGYFNQSLIGTQMVGGNEVFYGAGKRFQGFQFGVGIPISNGASKAKIRASELNEKIAQNQLNLNTLQLNSALQQAIQAYQTAEQSLTLYEQKTLVLAKTIRDHATRAYEAGEINYLEFAQAMTRAWNIDYNYLDLLDSYNQSVIEIEFLINKQ